MMKLVLSNKTIDIQVKNEHGVNGFWIACMFGHGEVMSLLADAGVDIMCVNNLGVNVLHLAVKQNYPTIVRMLLKSGFPLDSETNEGFTAFQLASFHGRKDIVDIMLENLMTLNEDIMNKILNQVNKQTNVSALAYAILYEHDDIAETLQALKARYGEEMSIAVMPLGPLTVPYVDD